MKKIYSIFLLLIPFVSLAKSDTLYFDATWHRTDKVHASYYRTYIQKGDHYFVTDHYLFGSVQMTGAYFGPYDNTSEDGYFIYFDSTGNKQLEGIYSDGQPDSIWTIYYFDPGDTLRYFLKDQRITNQFKDLDFSHCYFNGDLWLYNTKFTGNTNFLGAFISKRVNFNNSTFNGPALLSNIDFSGEQASFGSDTFAANLDCSGDTFRNEASFYGSVMLGPVRFDSATFNGKTSFAYCNFGILANFSSINLGRQATFDFTGALLPLTLDFSHIPKIENNIDLTAANFKDTTRLCYIYLYKTDVTRLHLDYKHFRLVLADPETNDTLAADEATTIYEALLKNFKDRGQTESYRDLDIEYQQYKYGRANQRWLGHLNKWWWNYGYNKELVFIHAGFFLLFFAMITFFILGFLNEHVYSLDDITYDIPLVSKYFKTTEVTLPESGDPGTTPDQREYIMRKHKTYAYTILISLFLFSTVIFVRLEQYVLHLNLINYIIHHTSLNFYIVLLFVVLVIWLVRKWLFQVRAIGYARDLSIRMWLSVVYTGNLFFPLFIKMEKIKYKHQLLVFYVLFVYLVGILCVGYMTNFIVQK